MPRANRYFLPGYVWHITHRCHNKEFLLRYDRDRQAWVRWLFAAKKRYGLEVLDFTVTSNHVHLLVYGGADREAIARSMQLVAGRTAQEYNLRKERKGPFWEDRYHATAVATDEHLLRCLVYIDLNMVRAGAVSHPGQWRHGGYHEILRQPARYRLLARERLAKLLSIDVDALGDSYCRVVDEALQRKGVREPAWSESIAVGSNHYVERVRDDLGSKALARKVYAGEDSAMNVLRERETAYRPLFDRENGPLSGDNGLVWDISDEYLDA